LVAQENVAAAAGSLIAATNPVRREAASLRKSAREAARVVEASRPVVLRDLWIGTQGPRSIDPSVS
jgi:hypothetical protein